MSSKLCRTILLALVVLALAGVAPGFADPAPAPAPQAASLVNSPAECGASALDLFAPATRDWFRGSFDAPTQVQERRAQSIGGGGMRRNAGERPRFRRDHSMHRLAAKRCG